MGYVEQTDIHSPQATVREALSFSAALRLPADTSDMQRDQLVQDVIKMVELDSLQDQLVGVPGLTGLSGEQRKRLTIAVELVSNPRHGNPSVLAPTCLVTSSATHGVCLATLTAASLHFNMVEVSFGSLSVPLLFVPAQLADRRVANWAPARRAAAWCSWTSQPVGWTQRPPAWWSAPCGPSARRAAR